MNAAFGRCRSSTLTQVLPASSLRCKVEKLSVHCSAVFLDGAVIGRDIVINYSSAQFGVATGKDATRLASTGS